MEAHLQERMRWWSYHRQHLGQTATTTEQVLREVGGVYSAHPSGPLSLHARVHLFSASELTTLERERRIVRIPAMRLSIYLVARETAHMITAATRTILSEYRYILQRHLITADDYPRIKEQILTHARQPMSIQAIKEALGSQDLPLSDILKTMCREGVLLRVTPTSLRSNTLQYVATEAWLGEELPAVDRSAALRWLAELYLHAFGPIRPADFIWWTGITAGEALQALSQVETSEIGDGYLLLQRDIPAFEKVRPLAKDSVDIMPKWDCYTMGYAPNGRQRLVTPEMQQHAYDSVGNALPVVLINGAVAGTWEARFAGHSMHITVHTFERLSPALRQQIQERMQAIGTLLQAHSTNVQVGLHSPPESA